MENYNYYSAIGNFGGGTSTSPAERKYTIIQSLWTKPVKDNARLRDLMFICATSLAYAHCNGYKVHMHTDSKGAELLKNFGYEKLLTTLDRIPETVPTDLFAAGKFYAMKAEGITGKVHIDVDVFIKSPGLLNMFYEDKRIDAICQMEEDMSTIDHREKIFHMHILGYPPTTRPNWYGSMNTGVVGFRNTVLAAKYFRNYYDALRIYTADKIEKYKKENGGCNLQFDFVLEQIQLSYLSVGYNVYTLLPTKNPCFVSDKIGYQHLQGETKWSAKTINSIKSLLVQMDRRLYESAYRAAGRAYRQPIKTT